jgi:NAD(P)-dependent dehydrogenase (short-subunit alcohol dehydrogenase family)
MITIELAGRRALLTGANSGLGRAIALNLVVAGTHVAASIIPNPV